MNTQDTRPTISPPAEALTVRQQFVMAAMQGLCANPEYADGSYGNITAVDACAIADAALAAEARTRK